MTFFLKFQDRFTSQKSFNPSFIDSSTNFRKRAVMNHIISDTPYKFRNASQKIKLRCRAPSPLQKKKNGDSLIIWLSRPINSNFSLLFELRYSRSKLGRPV